MKVAILAADDYSNVGYIMEQCLRTVGVDATAFKTRRHRFKYPTQAKVVPSMSSITEFIKSSDVVQVMHSMLPPGLNTSLIRNKKVVVFHGGGRYRLNSAKINKIFNPIVDLTIIQTPDLLNMGAKNEVWLLPAVDADHIKPDYSVGNELVIGHYPSSPIAKNSAGIDSVIKSLKEKNHSFIYKHSPDRATWQHQIERVTSCDIYIEKLVLENAKMGIGVWGLTALEAAACGDIVVTPFIHLNLYEKTIGRFGPCLANNREELMETLERLLSLPKQKIVKMKKRNRRWVETKHSYAVTGQKLKEVYEGIL